MTGRSGSPGDLGPSQGSGNPYDQTAPHRATNRLAITALAIAIVVPIIGGIPALILGYKARSQIRARNQAGKWVAIVAIIIGWLGVTWIAAALIAFVVGGVVALNRHYPG